MSAFAIDKQQSLEILKQITVTQPDQHDLLPHKIKLIELFLNGNPSSNERSDIKDYYDQFFALVNFFFKDK